MVLLGVISATLTGVGERKHMFATAIQKETLSEQEKTSLNALSQGRFFEINTGHDLMISEPEQTASVLNKITQM